jgi:hypothetical protein
MKNILEKNDYDKFMLFAYLQGSANQTISIMDIEKHFSLTYFKANKLIDGLNQDFRNAGLEDRFQVEKKNGLYYMEKPGLDSVNRLLWIYGKRSLKLIFISYFLQNEENTIDDFAYDYFISISKAYKTRSEVAEYLGSLGSNILELNSSEKNIRYFISELYFAIYKEYEEPFGEKVTQKVSNFIAALQEAGMLRAMHGLQYHKLKFYLCVTFFRNQKGHSQFDQLKPISDVTDKEVNRVVQLLKDFLVNDEELEDEAVALINYARINNFTSTAIQEEVEISSTFETPVRKALAVIFEYGTLASYRAELSESLSLFFGKFLYFDGHILDNQFYVDLNAFEENYSYKYQLCQNICKNEKLIKIMGDQSGNKHFQLSLLLRIIRIVPEDLMLAPVRITIDFSIDQEYNNFIANRIQNLRFTNLTIDNQYSSQTDIYLTDVLTDKVESEYLIWSGVPNSKNWETFRNLVTSVKEEKISFPEF